MALVSIGRWALLGVSALIALLAYGSQTLFHFIEPSPLDIGQGLIFNVLVACIWICYARACWTDPGSVPSEWNTSQLEEVKTNVDNYPESRRQRWCRKCEASKPPRAHHCKVCQRCVPKMDHHCPWTANCVSHSTFPHFIRFVSYAVASMIYLQYFLWERAVAVWRERHLPSYLGPSALAIGSLFVIVLINSITLLALSMLLIRTVMGLGENITTIEGWEIERHKTLVRRARVLGGYLDGPDGIRVKISRQEFPYDIGIWQNIRQGMGGGPLVWLWPFARTPSNESGLHFELNGFEDPSLSWPPPDPDRIPRQVRPLDLSQAFTYADQLSLQGMDVKAFRQRQDQDQHRVQYMKAQIQRRRPFHERYGTEEKAVEGADTMTSQTDKDLEGEESWRNADGERLDDFGVDEDADFYDEDDIPLSELMRKNQARYSEPVR